jgi:Gly-Xaa carboxypeptidase
MLTAIDILLSLDFTPKRTLIVSVGFDEEGGADQSYGARCLAEHLLKEYGMDSMEMIVRRRTFSLLSTAADCASLMKESLALKTTGETSSRSPPQLRKDILMYQLPLILREGIRPRRPTILRVCDLSVRNTAVNLTAPVGLLAQVIQIIEDHPFVSQLTPANPTYTYLRLAAEHSREMPQDLRDAILNGKSSDKIMKYLNETPETKALIQTSTAVTVVLGGVKGVYLFLVPSIGDHVLIDLSKRPTGECTHHRQSSSRSRRFDPGCKRSLHLDTNRMGYDQWLPTTRIWHRYRSRLDHQQEDPT